MRKNETGRSMVEMLGVLAIIGVLSIGGIAGYTLSMNRYRANAIVDMANKYASLVFGACQSQLATNNTALSSCDVPTMAELGLTSPEASVTIGGTNTKCAADKVTVPIAFGGKTGVSAAAASILGKADASTITYDFKQN